MFKKINFFVAGLAHLAFLFFLLPNAIAQPQPGLNVSGQITKLEPVNAAVIPFGMDFVTRVEANATNNENFLVAVKVFSGIYFWDEGNQKWIGPVSGTLLVDEKAVLPHQSVELKDEKIVSVANGFPQGSYRTTAYLDAFTIDSNGQIIFLTPLDSRTNYFVIQ